LLVLLQFSVSADEGKKKTFHPNTFYQRSVAPSLISLILSRSTGRFAPVDKIESVAAPELPKLEPYKPVSVLAPKLQPTVRAPKLNTDILKRLMAGGFGAVGL